MTKRTCPWCGGPNLILTNVSGMDPKRQYSSYHYWEDRECGYREKTSGTEYYDYQKSALVSCEREIISFRKPRPPLPVYRQAEYLRHGIVAEVPRGQTEIKEVVPA